MKFKELHEKVRDKGIYKLELIFDPIFLLRYFDKINLHLSSKKNTFYYKVDFVKVKGYPKHKGIRISLIIKNINTVEWIIENFWKFEHSYSFKHTINPFPIEDVDNSWEKYSAQDILEKNSPKMKKYIDDIDKTFGFLIDK